jgi:hypothetical protein
MISTLLNKFKENNYILFAVITTIITVIVKAYLHQPLNSTFQFGDEPSYLMESDYLAKYGLYNSLSQGTSVVLSLMIVLCSKIFSTSLLIAGRIYSVIAFSVSAIVLFRILKKYTTLSLSIIAFTLIYFATMCKGWLWRELADLAAMPFVLGSLYFLLQNKGFKSAALSGLFLFLGFAIKPTCLLMIPAFVAGTAILTYKTYGFKQSAISTLIWIGVFIPLFGLYHIPGYQVYNKLMLESKNHTYDGEKRVENKSSWVERNVYMARYNTDENTNYWNVTWETVDSFKKANPQINLNLGTSEYMMQNPVHHLKQVGLKIVSFLPYEIQSGFFFSLWTKINSLLKNDAILKFITLLLIASIYFRERELIKNNSTLFIVASLYFISLSLYVFIDLQNNWVVWCMPIFALPVVSFLTRYINIAVLILLQLGFIVLL